MKSSRESSVPALDGARPARRLLWRDHPALTISIIYGVVGVIYIAASDEAVHWVTSQPETITYLQTWKGWGFILVTTVLLFVLVDFSVRAIRAAERRQRVANERFRAMIETTNEGVALVDAAGKLEYVNHTLAAMLGPSPEALIGRDVREFVPPDHRTHFEQVIKLREDQSVRCECELQREGGVGTGCWVVVSASRSPHLLNEHESTLLMITDISARKQAERALEQNLEAQRSLLNELDHRVRNNLSSLASLIDLSRAAADDVDHFASIMGGRVQAMAKAHALSSRSGSGGMELARIIGEMIPDPVRSRISMDGPRVEIAHRKISALALFVHELSSRSQHEGALGRASGRATIRWSVERDSSSTSGSEIVLEWRESPAGDATDGPEEDSLISGLVRRELHAELTTHQEGDDLIHTLRLPPNRIRGNSLSAV